MCRENNNILVPVVLDRLHSYYPEFNEQMDNIPSLRPFSSDDDDSESESEDTSIREPIRRSNFSYFALRA